jgi:phosphoribosyl 1,2-cyclic phosphodiesterase
MFQTAVLASGSKGNSTLVQTETTALLIDAGLSGIKILTALEQLKIELAKIKGVLVSHEHSDHVKGVGIIARKLGIPVHVTAPTYNLCRKHIEPVNHGLEFFEHDNKFSIGDIIVEAFPSSHDVVDGSNFVFSKEGCSQRKLAHATDLGFGSRIMLHRIKESTTIILESNHDEEMLLTGPYPIFLKQRVKSKHGHLSNNQAVGVISQILHPGLKNLILAHLSEQNNLPELAHSVMDGFLKELRCDLNLIVSSQYEPTKLVDV